MKARPKRAGGPLSKGMVRNTTVMCPLHGTTFDLTTGEANGPLDYGSVEAYHVRRKGDEVQVASK